VTTHTDIIASRFGLTFRLARNDLEDGSRFCELFNSLYLRRINGDYYRWQFFETPFPSQLSMAVTRDGELAGCYGFHVLQSVPGDTHIAWALDIMVAPRFQEQGVFRALAEFATAKVLPHRPIALCVMANQRADGVHVHGLGWHRVNVLTSFACSISNTLSNPVKLGFSRCDDFEACAIGLISAQRDMSLASTFRSGQFLNWRFVRNPWYRYASFLVEYRGQPFGYLVLKVFRDPKTDQAFGDIVDILWDQHTLGSDRARPGFCRDRTETLLLLQSAR
jgi:GNAT superfamily N-acetyltransferase